MNNLGTPHRTIVLLLGMCLAALAGCGAATDPAKTLLGAEPSLVSQIADVRSGLLEDIEVNDRVVSDEDVRGLRLGSPHITDAGLAHLASLRQLRFLILRDAQVTDAGLARLAELENLESLYLERTQVTDAGVEQLKRALPQLHVHW